MTDSMSSAILFCYGIRSQTQDSGFVTEVHHITGEEGGSTLQNGSTVNMSDFGDVGLWDREWTLEWSTVRCKLGASCPDMSSSLKRWKKWNLSSFPQFCRENEAGDMTDRAMRLAAFPGKCGYKSETGGRLKDPGICMDLWDFLDSAGVKRNVNAWPQRCE